MEFINDLIMEAQEVKERSKVNEQILFIKSNILTETRGTPVQVKSSLVESIIIKSENSVVNNTMNNSDPDISNFNNENISNISNMSQCNLPFDGSHGFDKTRFFETVKYFTDQRKQHSKGTYQNALYKFLANAGIGQMTRGLSNKLTFETATGMNLPIPHGILTNPLYAGWVTALIRTVISELLNNIHSKGGLIISSTTDGFITNLEGLGGKSVGEFSEIYQKTAS